MVEEKGQRLLWEHVPRCVQGSIRGVFSANCQEGPEVSLVPRRSPQWRAGSLGVRTFRCWEHFNAHSPRFIGKTPVPGGFYFILF